MGKSPNIHSWHGEIRTILYCKWRRAFSLTEIYVFLFVHVSRSPLSAFWLQREFKAWGLGQYSPSKKLRRKFYLGRYKRLGYHLSCHLMTWQLFWESEEVCHNRILHLPSSDLSWVYTFLTFHDSFGTTQMQETIIKHWKGRWKCHEASGWSLCLFKTPLSPPQISNWGELFSILDELRYSHTCSHLDELR